MLKTLIASGVAVSRCAGISCARRRLCEPESSTALITAMTSVGSRQRLMQVLKELMVPTANIQGGPAIVMPNGAENELSLLASSAVQSRRLKRSLFTES